MANANQFLNLSIARDIQHSMLGLAFWLMLYFYYFISLQYVYFAQYQRL